MITQFIEKYWQFLWCLDPRIVFELKSPQREWAIVGWVVVVWALWLIYGWVYSRLFTINNKT